LLPSLLEGALPERLTVLARSEVAVGALSARIIADTLGLSIAIGSVGLLTFLSGVIVAFAMREKRQP
jgi:hypothetical protein